MPTWVWWFVPVFVFFVILAFVMSPPEAVANWFVNKYQLHPELRDEETEVSVEGKNVDGVEKKRIIEAFNKAVFIERYYKVMPHHSGTPVILDAKQGKKPVRFFIYAYEDHVDVFKQSKKKVAAYRLLSESFQSRSITDFKTRTQ